jgi:hypothetical protein
VKNKKTNESRIHIIITINGNAAGSRRLLIWNKVRENKVCVLKEAPWRGRLE